MFNLNIVVSVFLNKKLRNGNVRLCNLLIANFMALILSGCASVEYFGTTPKLVETSFWPEAV